MGKLSYPSTVGYLRNGRCKANTAETTASVATVMAPARRSWHGRSTAAAEIGRNQVIDFEIIRARVDAVFGKSLAAGLLGDVHRNHFRLRVAADFIDRDRPRFTGRQAG